MLQHHEHAFNPYNEFLRENVRRELLKNTQSVEKDPFLDIELMRLTKTISLLSQWEQCPDSWRGWAAPSANFPERLEFVLDFHRRAMTGMFKMVLLNMHAEADVHVHNFGSRVL
jgi:hypothetical protein